MKKNHIIILLLLLATSCAHKRYTRQGEKYEKAGLLQHAVERYAAALKAKNTYADARIGLMRTSALYANKIENALDKSYQNQDDNLVVDNYKALEDLVQLAESNGIEILISERTKGQYLEAKNRYVINHYALGKKLSENEKFDEALKHFNLIIDVSPYYADVEQLISYCKAEPLYRRGQLNMQFKKYRTAYQLFGSALNIDPNYKDSKELREEALYAGMLTVTFLPVQINNSHYKSVVNSIIANVNKAVEMANNPFLQMREQTQATVLQELQKQALAANQEIDITQTIPIRAALSCRLSNLTYNKSQLTRSIKKGFVKVKLKDDKVVFKKVEYAQYKQNARASINFSYSLLSIESGLNLFSGVINPVISDNVEYIVFDGDKQNLYSGNWEKKYTPFDPKKDIIHDTFISKSQMRMLIYGKKTLESEYEMKNKLIIQTANKLAEKLISYNPEN